MLADDYSAHKSDNVWQLCWSRGYILLIHGGGNTPVAQTPDTDLNEHVRREYGNQECAHLMEKMRAGQLVPKLTHEECLEIMFRVLSDLALHEHASRGYKKVGQSVKLDGSEGAEICREAGVFWNERTTDGYANMRVKVNVQLTAVAEEFRDGSLQWSQRNVKRLISPYPRHEKVDKILENIGDEFYHDEVHNLIENGDEDESENEDPEVQSEEDESEEDDGDVEWDPAVAADTAVADPAIGAVNVVDTAEAFSQNEDALQLSAAQADHYHASRASIAALSMSIEAMKGTGLVRVVQTLEHELHKEERRERELVRTQPAVAEAFLRFRRADQLKFQEEQRRILQLRKRKAEAAEAISVRKAAEAELKKAKKALLDLESHKALKHAVKTFTVEALGGNTANAGGAKGKRNRHEVLDRLSRHQSGLSDAQKNDFGWWKDEWDAAMVQEFKHHWAEAFAGYVQKILDDPSPNAFSKFVYNETVRVLHGQKALAVPGTQAP